MANPNISLLGATYSAVAGVTLPKSGGGTATFPWVEGSETVTQNGTFDVTNLAQMVVNVAGGGGSGLEYEEGELTLSADSSRLTVSFANSHSEAPALIAFVDATNTANTATYTNWSWVWFDFYKLWGNRIYYSSSAMRYAIAYYTYRANSTSSLSVASTLCQNNSDSSSASGTSYPKYWATNTEFHPYSNSTSRYWRSGRTYKWIAIWA